LDNAPLRVIAKNLLFPTAKKLRDINQSLAFRAAMARLEAMALLD
jgi:hypothetical protein